MKSQCAVLARSLLCLLGITTNILATGTNEMVLRRLITQDNATKAKLIYDYSITDDHVMKLSTWDPTKETVPLSIRDAIEAARKYLQDDLNDLEVDAVELRSIRVHLPSQERVWYYEVHFLPQEAHSPRWQTISMEVVVMFDGTIIEPQPKQK